MAESLRVAYINIEADDLLRICFEQLGKQQEYTQALELVLRGTLPKKILEDIEKNSMLQDPKGLSDRFSPQKRIFIDSWSELLNLGSLTYFYDTMHPYAGHLISSIGIESAYRESHLREKFLGDGAIAIPGQSGRQIVQSCLAQNIRGKSAGKSLQQEIIIRLNAKLTNSPSEPERILAVTIVSETKGFDKLDFFQIAHETIGQHRESTYGPIFCVMPSVGVNGPQIVVIPLTDFLPSGKGRAAIIEGKSFIEPEYPS